MDIRNYYEWCQNHKYENGVLVFLDSVSFLCALRKLPEAFGLRATKSWYPHYFNTEGNLDYVGPSPDIVLWSGRDGWRGHASLRRSTLNVLKHTVTMTSRFYD